MEIKTDIQIAQECEKEKITEIAKKVDIDEKYLELYGNYKAKVDYKLLNELKDRPDGKLILVTAITPTPAGEGKTTTSVGLTDGLRKIGKKALVALREPSPSMRLVLPTIFWQRCSTTIYSRAMCWELTRAGSLGREQST